MAADGDSTRLKVFDPESTAGKPSGNLMGGGTVHPFSPLLGTDEIKINLIKFEPGARFRPHKHSFDQILYYETGTGIVAIDGGPDVIVPTGQLVILPADVVHMHGCTDDAPARQWSLMQDTTTTFDVECPRAWRHWLDP